MRFIFLLILPPETCTQKRKRISGLHFQMQMNWANSWHLFMFHSRNESVDVKCNANRASQSFDPILVWQTKMCRYGCHGDPIFWYFFKRFHVDENTSKREESAAAAVSLSNWFPWKKHSPLSLLPFILSSLLLLDLPTDLSVCAFTYNKEKSEYVLGKKKESNSINDSQWRLFLIESDDSQFP